MIIVTDRRSIDTWFDKNVSPWAGVRVSEVVASQISIRVIEFHKVLDCWEKNMSVPSIGRRRVKIRVLERYLPDLEKGFKHVLEGG